MIQRTYKMPNPIFTCDELENVISGVKLQKIIPDEEFKMLHVEYWICDNDKTYVIPEQVYNVILKMMNK